jgi:hypothetical protein
MVIGCNHMTARRGTSNEALAGSRNTKIGVDEEIKLPSSAGVNLKVVPRSVPFTRLRRIVVVYWPPLRVIMGDKPISEGSRVRLDETATVAELLRLIFPPASTAWSTIVNDCPAMTPGLSLDSVTGGFGTTTRKLSTCTPHHEAHPPASTGTDHYHYPTRSTRRRPTAQIFLKSPVQYQLPVRCLS